MRRVRKKGRMGERKEGKIEEMSVIDRRKVGINEGKKIVSTREKEETD